MFNPIFAEVRDRAVTWKITEVNPIYCEFIRGDESLGDGAAINVKGAMRVDGEKNDVYVDVCFPVFCTDKYMEDYGRMKFSELLAACGIIEKDPEIDLETYDFSKLKGKQAYFPVGTLLMTGLGQRED